ncbi:MAG TPA: molybdopterin-binding protein, partial [Sedimentisphaerales bacterium]|nr:molybdopterin-binding protein [Sedimentisphaerales bacterium]
MYPNKSLTATVLLLCASVILYAGNSQLEVAHEQNTDTIPAYEVFEIAFEHENEYADPFFDVAIDVVFASPSGKQMKIGGFHYGSSTGPKISKQKTGERLQITYQFDKQNIWKARFAPGELGNWTYSFTFTNAEGRKASGKGAFSCIKGRKPNRGFIRLHPTNPFRFVFDDGTAYFPIGIQDCWGDDSGTGSILDQCAMEGPFRTDLKAPPPLPSGPVFVRGPANNPQNADVFFRCFSKCGFNLYRYSQQNCSFPLNHDLNKYLVQEGVMTDELLCYARKYGFGIFYGIFGFQQVFNNEAGSEENMAKVKRFIKYSVDRWGAYVDFWEFLNEQKADDKWYEITIPYLQSIDPYHHPITTSWERPELAGIEINAPHWYQRENELESDAVTASRAADWKKHGKPVVVGEQGNHVDTNNRPLGVGGVWDDRSALRMRIRNWTALFNEIAFIFWNTSYARDGHFMNMWLGPKEREYVRAMQDFAYRLDEDVRPVEVTVSDPHAVRAYALASKKRAGVYLHHFADHEKEVKGLKITVDVPDSATGYWYSPETGGIIKTIDAPKGTCTFDVPEFAVDLALLITPDGPPDIDNDGRSNHLDLDDDNDGVPDLHDAFPLEPEESKDADKDLIGDNLDADDNGDGLADDENKNAEPDWEELDFDGDGIDRAKSLPWDAFPFDLKEWLDTDGDGAGDNADPDDDNDGWTDQQESSAGTDPMDKLSFPSEAQLTRYMIIVTGGELLAGAYADGHTQFITKTLGLLGLRCVGSMCVDDTQADIEEALGFAAAKADLIIVTGGLGPTANDVTREALCAFTKIPLEENPDVLREMTQRFGVSPAELRQNLRRQAQAPTQGTYLKNRNGTAIGLVFEQPQTTIVALPG